CVAVAARADQLSGPQAAEREGAIQFSYRLDRKVTGTGALDIEWIDALGRLVEKRRISLSLVDAAEIPFSLDMRRSAATRNTLTAHLTIETPDGQGSAIHRESTASTTLIATPQARDWSDFPIIIWHPQPEGGYAALKRLGVTAGMVEADRRGETT